jgi:hypothetical protein
MKIEAEETEKDIGSVNKLVRRMGQAQKTRKSDLVPAAKWPPGPYGKTGLRRIGGQVAAGARSSK